MAANESKLNSMTPEEVSRKYTERNTMKETKKREAIYARKVIYWMVVVHSALVS